MCRKVMFHFVLFHLISPGSELEVHYRATFLVCSCGSVCASDSATSIHKDIPQTSV